MNITKTIIQFIENKNTLGKLNAELISSLKDENYELASWIRDQSEEILAQNEPLETILKTHQSKISRFDLDYIIENRFLNNIITIDSNELHRYMLFEAEQGSVILLGEHLSKKDRHIDLNINQWPSWFKFLRIRKHRIKHNLSDRHHNVEELTLINDILGSNRMHILQDKWH